MSNILRPIIDELQLLPNCLKKLEMYQSDPDIAFDTKEHKRHDQSVLLIPNRQNVIYIGQNTPKLGWPEKEWTKQGQAGQIGIDGQTRVKLDQIDQFKVRPGLV
ncbi:hypothetical protein FCV25MIE_09221 [Fagus crenata]